MGADVLLIETGGMHRATFNAVGIVNNKLGLAKLVPYLGYRGYGLLLSNVYWGWRGYLEKEKDNVYDIFLENLRADLDLSDFKEQLNNTLNKSYLKNKSKKLKEYSSEILN